MNNQIKLKLLNNLIPIISVMRLIRARKLCIVIWILDVKIMDANKLSIAIGSHIDEDTAIIIILFKLKK